MSRPRGRENILVGLFCWISGLFRKAYFVGLCYVNFHVLCLFSCFMSLFMFYVSFHVLCLFSCFMSLFIRRSRGTAKKLRGFWDWFASHVHAVDLQQMVCCSVLQCVAVCCSELQGVAEHCNLQCTTRYTCMHTHSIPVCTRTHAHTIFARTHVHIDIRATINIHTYTRTHTDTLVHTCTHADTRIHTYTHTDTHIHTCTHSETHIHTYTHSVTHIHTYSLSTSGGGWCQQFAPKRGRTN